MSFWSNSRGYTPVGLPVDDHDMEEKPASPKSSLTDRIIFWSTIVIVLCAVIDVGAFMAISFGHIGNQNAYQVDVEDLPFRNMYAGLSRLYSDPNTTIPTREPITNVPRRLFTVDTASKPHRMILQPKKYRHSQYGLVWNNDMSFNLGPTTASVAQFRIMDWGMDRCVLKFTTPLEDAHPAAVVDPNVVVVDVWRLEAARMPVLEDGAVFDSARVNFMGSVSVSHGAENSLPFECRSGDLHTFEFSSMRGTVSLKPDRVTNVIGPYVVQSQSI